MSENEPFYAINITPSTPPPPEDVERRFPNTLSFYTLRGSDEVQSPILGWSTQVPSSFHSLPWDASLMRYPRMPTYLTAEPRDPSSPILGSHSPAAGHSSSPSISPDWDTFKDLAIEDPSFVHPGDGPHSQHLIDQENQDRDPDPDPPTHAGFSSSSDSLNIALATFEVFSQDGQDASAQLSPITFAHSVDNSPLDGDPLVLYDPTYSPVPPYPTLGVGSTLDNVECPRHLIRSDSGRSRYSTTSSSEGVTGSDFSPFYIHGLFMNPSHSSSSFSVGDASGADTSGGKWDSQMTMPELSVPYTLPTGHLYQLEPSCVHEFRRDSFPPARQITSGWPEQAIESRSFFPPKTPLPQDLGPSEPSPNTGVSTPSSQALASKAILAASGKRRMKDARYQCSFCPQKLTSRDNLISHEDIHNNIKRYPCENCGRRFRTRAVLKRHHKGSRCLTSGRIIMAAQS